MPKGHLLKISGSSNAVPEERVSWNGIRNIAQISRSMTTENKNPDLHDFSEKCSSFPGRHRQGWISFENRRTEYRPVSVQCPENPKIRKDSAMGRAAFQQYS